MSKVYAKARVNVRSTKSEDCGSAVVVIGTDRIDCAKPTITTLLTPSMVKEG